MSRKKSRSRNELELVHETSVAEMLEPEGAGVHPITGELRNALDAIVTGCALTAVKPIAEDILDEAADRPDFDDLLDDAADDDSPSDDELDTELDALAPELAEFGLAFAGIQITTRILARWLLARALGHDSRVALPPSVASLDELAGPLLPANIPEAIRPTRADRKAAYDEAAVLIREVGLEEFDVSSDLTTAPDGTDELFVYPVSPEAAHVALLEFLFDRAESVAFGLDPLLEVEREASAWEFSRWGVAPPPGGRSPGEASFARRVREQEYSLAARRTITLGTTVMEELAGDEGFAELFPRQHRMAGALAASFVDVFECVALNGHHATFRSVRDGRTFEVHEHMDPIEYRVGWVALGRLVPFDGELHLRSPGMLFIPVDPDVTSVAAAALDVGLPPALALEGFISSAVFGVNVPRAMKPARSRADARDTLSAIRNILDDEDVERDSMPDEEIQPDATLSAFMAALAEQAEAGGAREDRRRARAQKGKTRRRR